MSKLRLAAWAVLVAALPALSTGARAAPAFPRAVAAGAAHADVLLVQGYGGRRDEDDDPPARHQPQYRPQEHNRPHNNNGGVMLQNIIRGIGEAVQEQRRREQAEKNRRQEEDLRRRAIDEQRRRNLALQEERKRRARQEEQDRIRRHEQAERDRARKLHQQKIDDEKAAEDRRHKQEEYADHNNNNNNNSNNNSNNNNNNSNINNNNNSNNGYPAADNNNNNNNNNSTVDNSNDNNDSYPSELENHVRITIILVPNNDLPPFNVVPPLPITHDKQLPACGYVSLPADRDVCTGRTAGGAWLRVVPVSTPGGGTKQVCMSYCSKPPVIHKKRTVVTKRDEHIEEEHKKLTPAIRTVKADEYTEEEHRKLTPAIRTVKADEYTEEQHKKLTPAIRTVKADEYTEEQHKKLTPAIRTVKADEYTEEQHKKLTPAISTVKAQKHTQLEDEHLTPAIRTVKADASDRALLTPAILTVVAHPFTQPDFKRPQPDSRQANLNGGQLDEAIPTEPPDSKACTPAGARPLTTAISEPLAKYNPPAFSPREVATTAIAGIPYGIGNVISATTKMFWKDDSPNKLFDAMKSYVDHVVPAALDQYDETQLGNDLTAIRKLLKGYDSNWTPSTKGAALSELVTQLETMKPRFLNARSPKSTIAEFVAFGTLHLSTLRELYDHYDQYYPFDPRDATAVRNHEHDRGLVKDALNDAIKEYQDHIPVIRNDIIAYRLAKLGINDRGDVHSVFWSVDAPDVLVTNDYFSAKDDFCDWHEAEHKDNRFAALADMARRQAVVKAAYDKLVDEFTAPITRWKRM
jgi:hypothetical protein